MPTFEIEQYEIRTQKYRIEAPTVAEAIVKLLDGEALPCDGSPEFVEIAGDFGLPVDEHQDLAEELTAFGVPVGEHVIPSICSIEQVE